MHNIITVLYCFDLATRPSQKPLFRKGCLEGYDEPKLLDACMADMESGKLKVELLTPIGQRKTFHIPHQKEEYAVCFQTPFVFEHELKELLEFEKERSIFLYWELDRESGYLDYHELICFNQDMDNNSIGGISDSLVINKVESLESLVTYTFTELYLVMAGYDKRLQFSGNHLLGLTEAIYEGSEDGTNAQTFHEIFPAAECREIIKKSLKIWF